jgi:hypothetical protein
MEIEAYLLCGGSCASFKIRLITPFRCVDHFSRYGAIIKILTVFNRDRLNMQGHDWGLHIPTSDANKTRISLG